MVHSFAQLKTTPEVIQQDLGLSPEEFDKQFLDWVNRDAGQTAANFDEWHKDLKQLVELAKAHDNDGVLKLGETVRNLYPDYVYDVPTPTSCSHVGPGRPRRRKKLAAAAILTAYEKLWEAEIPIR